MYFGKGLGRCVATYFVSRPAAMRCMAVWFQCSVLSDVLLNLVF